MWLAFSSHLPEKPFNHPHLWMLRLKRPGAERSKGGHAGFMRELADLAAFRTNRERHFERSHSVTLNPVSTARTTATPTQKGMVKWSSIGLKLSGSVDGGEGPNANDPPAP